MKPNVALALLLLIGAAAACCNCLQYQQPTGGEASGDSTHLNGLRVLAKRQVRATAATSATSGKLLNGGGAPDAGVVGAAGASPGGDAGRNDTPEPDEEPATKPKNPNRARPKPKQKQQPQRHRYNDDDDDDDDDDKAAADGGADEDCNYEDDYRNIFDAATRPMRRITSMMGDMFARMPPMMRRPDNGRVGGENGDNDDDVGDDWWRRRRPTGYASAAVASSSAASDGDESRTSSLVSSNGRTRGVISVTRNGRTETRRIGRDWNDSDNNAPVAADDDE